MLLMGAFSKMPKLLRSEAAPNFIGLVSSCSNKLKKDVIKYPNKAIISEAARQYYANIE